MNISLIPQSRIYSIFSDKNPLKSLAQKFPENMCWLTTLFYALQFLGLENNRKLHFRLTHLLSSSLGLLFISKENGAMYFPKKYEVSDEYIKSNLNRIFKLSHLGVKVIKIMSDIKFGEIKAIENYLDGNKELVAIIKNTNLITNTKDKIIGEAPNHTVLIKEFKDNGNGTISIYYIDPSDGNYHTKDIGVNIFMQWIQYIWVLERKYSLLDIILGRNKAIHST